MVAAKKGEVDMALGNVIGSNVFNILFVLGTTALISPNAIAFENGFISDGIVAIGALFLLYAFIDNDLFLKKSGAIVMLIGYIAYFISVL